VHHNKKDSSKRENGLSVYTRLLILLLVQLKKSAFGAVSEFVSGKSIMIVSLETGL